MRAIGETGRAVAIASAIAVLGGTSLARAQSQPEESQPEESQPEESQPEETAAATAPTPDDVASEAIAAEDAATEAATARADEHHAIGEALWISGLSVFAATYVLTGATTTTLVNIANGRQSTLIESWIPLVGPWAMLADSRGFDSSQLGLTIASALLQTFGVAAFIAGVILDSEGPDPVDGARVWITPTGGEHGAGLSVGGRF